jgi:transcriptional regulator with XRE-family HTH domain
LTFGDRLKEEREARGLSRRALASLASLGEATLREYESGDIAAINEGARKIAAALGVDVFDLRITDPTLFDLDFPILDSGPVRLAVEALPRDMVSPWPDTGDDRLRLRARASALPSVLRLANQPEFGAPIVRPVGASPDLSVLVEATGTMAAQAAVLTETTRAKCCPKVDLERRDGLWAARLRGVPARCSLVLQRLRASAPVGLFVPMAL